MIKDSITRFLRLLGAEDITEGDEWVNCTCPLAEWTHSSGFDSRPSFGLSINDEGTSVYFCFGCTEEARPLPHLLHLLYVCSGSYNYEAAGLLVREEIWSTDGDDFVRTPDTWEQFDERPIESPLPLEVLRKYPLLQGANDSEARKIRMYMERERGLPEWVQNLYRLRYDYDKRAIIFPLTDETGRIFLLRSRRRNSKGIWTISKKSGFPDLTFPRLKYIGVWFGYHLIDWSKPVMLVEGEFDVMRIVSLGFFNVMGSTTSSLSKAQIDALLGDDYILGYDNDKAGRKASKRIKERLKNSVNFRTADWSVVGCGDGGDLESKEELSVVLSCLE